MRHIDVEDHRTNLVADLEDLLGVLDLAGPRHLGDVHQALDALLELDEGAALQRINEWGGQPLPLNASRWTSSAGADGQLWLRLRGGTQAARALRRTFVADGMRIGGDANLRGGIETVGYSNDFAEQRELARTNGRGITAEVHSQMMFECRDNCPPRPPGACG